MPLAWLLGIVVVAGSPVPVPWWGLANATVRLRQNKSMEFLGSPLPSHTYIMKPP